MPRPADRVFLAPTPTRTTIFFRTFFPWQLVRFAWINLKMIRMIFIGNHGRPPLAPIVLPEPGGERRANPDAAPHPTH